MGQKLTKYRWYIFTFCFLLIAWRAFTITTANGKGRDNVYGDSYSDINTLSAARFFYDSGFIVSYGLPVHQYDSVGDTKHNTYTHYPALPDILVGVYAYVLHTTREPLLRIFPILLSMLWFFLIYRVLKQYLKDDLQAFVGGSLLVLSNYFIAWADNLHKHALEEFLKWLYMYCIYQYFTVGQNKNKWLVAMCATFLIAVNISFEPATYLAVISIGFSLIYTRKLFTPATILPGIAAVVGFLLHFWQDIAYWGGLDAALTDMEAAFVLRTTGQETIGYTASEIGDKSFGLHQLAFEWFNRIERYYLIPGWAFLVLGFWGVRDMYKNNRRLFFITLTIFIATLSWSFAMMHHAYVHMFTSRHWGIFIGLVCGYTLPMYWAQVKMAFAQKKYPPITIHVLFIGYIAAMAISQQVYALYLKHGFAFGWL